jgi:lamin tail-like protein
MAMRARLGAALVSAVLMAAASVGLTTPAQAGLGIVISKIYYDSPGSDGGSNTSLNGEYITLKNLGKTNRVITGWTVRDPTGHVYKFPTTTIKAGSTVTVRSGHGTNGVTTRYWQQSWYVWNNTGDTAYLRSPSGSLIDKCSWGSSGSSRYC